MKKKLTKKEKWQGVHWMIPLLLLCTIDADRSPIWVTLLLVMWFAVAAIPLIKKDNNKL